MGDEANTCASCKHFKARPLPAGDAGARAVANAAGHGVNLRAGTCRRFPQFVQREPEDLCGEYRPHAPVTLPPRKGK